eukprot:Selendium_serpulae@DN5080_c0_g1_i1.p1
MGHRLLIKCVNTETEWYYKLITFPRSRNNAQAFNFQRIASKETPIEFIEMGLTPGGGSSRDNGRFGSANTNLNEKRFSACDMLYIAFLSVLAMIGLLIAVALFPLRFAWLLCRVTLKALGRIPRSMYYFFVSKCPHSKHPAEPSETSSGWLVLILRPVFNCLTEFRTWLPRMCPGSVVQPLLSARSARRRYETKNQKPDSSLCCLQSKMESSGWLTIPILYFLYNVLGWYVHLTTIKGLLKEAVKDFFVQNRALPFLEIYAVSTVLMFVRLMFGSAGEIEKRNPGNSGLEDIQQHLRNLVTPDKALTKSEIGAYNIGDKDEIADPTTSQREVVTTPAISPIALGKADVNLERFCWTCLIVRDYRVKHCRTCDCCVDCFDHHCVWIGKCVGGKNHRIFVIWLFCLAMLQLVDLGLCVWAAWNLISNLWKLTASNPHMHCGLLAVAQQLDPAISLVRNDSLRPCSFLERCWSLVLSVDINLFALIVLYSCFVATGPFSFFLLFDQLRNVSTNVTTNERLSSWRYSHFWTSDSGSQLFASSGGKSRSEVTAIAFLPAPKPRITSTGSGDTATPRVRFFNPFQRATRCQNCNEFWTGRRDGLLHVADSPV